MHCSKASLFNHLVARASSTAHRGNRASLWNWLELQFVGGRIDEPEFGVGLLRNRSAEKREVFVGVRPVLPIAHSADCISDLIAEAILFRSVVWHEVHSFPPEIVCHMPCR